MASSVFIGANGARTPLGLRAAPSAAALRAGISGMRERPLLVDRPWTLRPAAFDSKIETVLTGPDRLLALARSAFYEVCAPFRSSRPLRLRLPLYLGLPELRPGFSRPDGEAVRDGIVGLDELPIELLDVKVFTEGHSAGLLALATATEQIRQESLEMCLVGGVDSYFHPDTIQWLDRNRQLAGGDMRSAFVPGEGAGFCLVASGRALERLGITALARVVAVAIGKETRLIKTEDICLGEGLTKTVQIAVGSLATGETINEVICDINGERYRGEEWGFVCLRLSQHFDDPTNYLSPADCWGDMGAASTPLFAMLACQAGERGYAKGPRTMLWASSEGGLRGAAVLETLGKV